MYEGTGTYFANFMVMLNPFLIRLQDSAQNFLEQCSEFLTVWSNEAKG